MRMLPGLFIYLERKRPPLHFFKKIKKERIVLMANIKFWETYTQVSQRNNNLFIRTFIIVIFSFVFENFQFNKLLL